MSQENKLPRDTDGKLSAYAWPGGYPIYYLAKDNGTLCPACANGENGSECFTDPAEAEKHDFIAGDSWHVVAADIHDEGEPIVCDHCYAEIESAYGNPDADDS